MNATERPKPVLTEEQIEKQYSSSMDSVKLLNEINLKEEKTQEDLETIERNKEHLSSFLNRDYIKSDNRDKSIFLEALS